MVAIVGLSILGMSGLTARRRDRGMLRFRRGDVERIELITTEPRQVVVVELVRAGRSVDRQARMFAVQSRFRRASA